MKQVDGVKPFRFQAWVGLVSATVLTLASILLEDGQWTAATTTGRPLVAAVVFTALIVSVGAHSVYYHLIDRYEANLLAPLTLMTPLATIGLGVLITHDHLDMRMDMGGGLAMLGALVVALRRQTATNDWKRDGQGKHV